MSKYSQCKCCWTLDFGDPARDEKGRCRKCQVYCPDTLVHCSKILEINRNTGELIVVDLAQTFGESADGDGADIENSQCFNCYWSAFPCNGCLRELFIRRMDLTDIVKIFCKTDAHF